MTTWEKQRKQRRECEEIVRGFFAVNRMWSKDAIASMPMTFNSSEKINCCNFFPIYIAKSILNNMDVDGDNDFVGFGADTEAAAVVDSSNNCRITNEELQDREPIEPQEAHRYGVLICVPFLYPHTNEQSSNDKFVPNLRVINYKNLVELTCEARKIAKSNSNEQLEICDFYSKRFDAIHDESVQGLIKFLRTSCNLTKELELNEQHIDIGTEAASFDVIRNFINDKETGLLTSAEPTIVYGYQFYSQIPSEHVPGLEQTIRQQTNDTDLNRIYLQMEYFQKALLFRPKFFYGLSLQMVNLALHYLSLVFESIPILNLSSNDLKSNILGYIFDVIIRSRVIQAWHNDVDCKKLLVDIIRNYDPQHYLVMTCCENTAEKRANVFLRLLLQNKKYAQFVEKINYTAYKDLLLKSVVVIENESYYLINNTFIINIIEMLDLMRFIDLVKGGVIDGGV